jgi:dethiobiotin synthetase
MQRRNIPVVGVILNRTELVAPAEQAADDMLIAENVEMIERFSGVPVLGVLPWYGQPEEDEDIIWADWRSNWLSQVLEHFDMHKFIQRLQVEEL